MQLAGLAFATSISSLVTITLLFFSLRRKIGNFGEKNIFSVLAKSLISAGLMAIVTTFSYKFINNILGQGFIQNVITLGLAVLAGAIVYGISIILLKVSEVNVIIDGIKSKLKKK
jgi:putative peptidoglycan lipid II flippase